MPANPLTVGVILDSAHQVVEVVPTSGGTIKTVGADGTSYTLTIPADALIEQTEISITPITGLTGSPISGGRVVGLHFEPEGLRFFQPVSLEIVPPDGNAAVDAVGFAYEGDGEQFHLHPVGLDPNRIVLTLFHFSGAGVVMGHPEFTPIIIINPPPVSFVPVDWEHRIQHQMQELFRREREAALRGDPGDPQFAEKLEALLIAYFNKVVGPMLPRIETDCTFAKENAPKALAFGRTVALVLPGHIAMSEAVVGSVGRGIQNCFHETIEPCLDHDDAEQMAEATRFARQAVLMGGDVDEFNPLNPDYACESMVGGRLTYTHSEERIIDNNGFVTRVRIDEVMNVDVKVKADMTGSLRDFGTTYDYSRDDVSRTECGLGESSVSSSGTPTHVRVGVDRNRMHFDVGGFTATGTSRFQDLCDGGGSSGPISRHFSEILTGAGCDPLNPNTPTGLLFSGQMQGDSADFACSSTITTVTPDPSGRPGSTTTTHVVTVSGTLESIAIPPSP